MQAIQFLVEAIFIAVDANAEVNLVRTSVAIGPLLQLIHRVRRTTLNILKHDRVWALTNPRARAQE